MIIGTAGHVDHGKTSLVRALTGVDTDRLAEEKARGISIELGFAYAQLDDADEAAEPFGFIDVPGHRKFVQTMIAGAAGVDLALLVIAADDGPMPQTREHLEIMQWLGVSKVIVALSKVDAVDAARAITAEEEIERLLADTPYRGAKIMPVSTVDGHGLAALKALLIAHRDRIEPADADIARAADGRFRLAIDRAFVLQGIGLVVTGTCFSGRVAIDDQLTLLPNQLTARVRGIHAQNQAVREAHAGQRVALNLAGRGIEKSSVHRGDWIVAPSIVIETDRIDVQLLPAVAIEEGAQRFDERNWRSVRFHAGAASCNARVVLLERTDDREPAMAQIVFEHAMHVVTGDRFVLRDASQGDDASGSIAGGVVLDLDVPTRGRRSDERLRFLKAAAAGDRRATLAHAVETSAKGVDLERWNTTHNTAFDATTIEAHAVGDANSGITLFSSARWDAMLAHLLAVLAAEHERAPDAVGPGRDRLRRMAAPSLNAATFGALIDAQKAAGRLAQTNAWLHLSEHRVAVSPDERQRFDRAIELLRHTTEPNNPPRIRDLARELGEDEAVLRTTFIRFASLGEVYRVAHDHYFVPEIVHELAHIARAVAEADGVARAAPFRDRIGVGRKVAIQILEFFDRVGFTRRIGDDHRVIQPTLFDG